MKKCDMDKISGLSLMALLVVILIIGIYKNRGKIGKIEITVKQWKMGCKVAILGFTLLLISRIRRRSLAGIHTEGMMNGMEEIKPFEIEHEKDLINEFPRLFHQDKKAPCSSKILAEGGLTDFENCGKKMEEMFGQIKKKKDGENDKGKE